MSRGRAAWAHQAGSAGSRLLEEPCCCCVCGIKTKVWGVRRMSSSKGRGSGSQMWRPESSGVRRRSGSASSPVFSLRPLSPRCVCQWFPFLSHCRTSGRQLPSERDSMAFETAVLLFLALSWVLRDFAKRLAWLGVFVPSSVCACSVHRTRLFNVGVCPSLWKWTPAHW